MVSSLFGEWFDRYYSMVSGMNFSVGSDFSSYVAFVQGKRNHRKRKKRAYGQRAGRK